MQGPPCPLKRAFFASAMAPGLLVEALVAAVEGVCDQAHDVERVHYHRRAGQLLGRGGHEAAQPAHRDDLDPDAPLLRPVASHCLNTCFERPSTKSSGRAGPVRARIGNRPMITVTYLSPRRVGGHTCSSTPIVVTPAKWTPSSKRTRLPSASTAALAVFQHTPRPSAIRATLRYWHTTPSSAHPRPQRETFARGWPTLPVLSWRRTCPHSAHR